MTYNERLLRVKTALLKIKEDHDIVIGHYSLKNPKGDYITWSEDVYGEMYICGRCRSRAPWIFSRKTSIAPLVMPSKTR